MRVKTILFITFSDFKPDKVISLIDNKNPVDIVESTDTLKFISWNIGYAGLGAEMDFFYDGGKKVRPTKQLGRKYLDGIKTFVQNNKIDYWLFQEVAHLKKHRALQRER